MSKAETIICKRCKSSNVYNWKNYKKCKDCGYSDYKGIKNTYKGRIECKDCGSTNVRKNGKAYWNKHKQLWECNDCGAFFVIKSKIKIRHEERKEWVKWIKDEVKRGKDLKEIREFIMEYTGIGERGARYLIQQAVGRQTKKITEKDILKAIDLKNKGWTWDKVAKAINCSISGIRDAIRKYKKKKGEIK